MERPGDRTLHRFFLDLSRRAFATLGVGDPATAEYVAGVCRRFARTDALYAIRDEYGRALTNLVDIARAVASMDELAGARIHRQVGDFALFMSGLFRAFVVARGVLGLYLTEGAAAYRRAAAAGGAVGAQPLLLAELARHFEEYAGALDFMRHAYFARDSGYDPFASFLRELRELTGEPSLS